MADTIQGTRTWSQAPRFDGQDAGVGPPDDDDRECTDRSLNAAASDRFSAFVSGGVPGGVCCDFERPDHDFDRCVGASVSSSVLFKRQDGDVDAIDAMDVQQGKLGDCYLCATLAALASTARGRALIRGAIVENRDDVGEVASWTVTLHQRQGRFGMVRFREAQVTVDGPYVIGHARRRQGELWPLIVEKAYAKYAGGYNAIGRGGQASEAMAVLTGLQATRVSLDLPARWFRSYGADEAQADLANGKVVVLTSRASSEGANHLIGQHAYWVKGVEWNNGKAYLKLGNPWGNVGGPDRIPCDELSTWFSSVAVGAVP